MDLLRLNAMSNFIANVKHHIYACIYTEVNIYIIFTLIFTAYVKVQIHIYTTFATDMSKVDIYLSMYLLYVCSH